MTVFHNSKRGRNEISVTGRFFFIYVPPYQWPKQIKVFFRSNGWEYTSQGSRKEEKEKGKEETGNPARRGKSGKEEEKNQKEAERKSG